ncbi:MAG: uncharacterized protein A8A55_1614 [Amphiamblys sp. WSBS2006]|nr:MAG: uncharacterized protein A8A55_1614 [Amphiamblys sp. WSBS2006]
MSELFSARECLVELNELIQEKSVPRGMYLMPSGRAGYIADGVCFLPGRAGCVVFRVQSAEKGLQAVFCDGFVVPCGSGSLEELLSQASSAAGERDCRVLEVGELVSFLSFV